MMSLRRLVFACAFGLGLVAAGPGAARAEGAASPPKLDFSVMERGPGLPWSMTIVNRGQDDVRLSADPRLLWFEVKAPGKKATQTCRLPGTLFPSRPDRRVKVELAPGEGVTHAFDPRLYCFAAGGQWLLVPGALISPHFGWKQKTKPRYVRGKRIEEPAPKQTAPYVAVPLDADDDDDDVGALKEITAQTFALRSEYAEWSRTRIEQEEKKKKPQFEMKVVQGSDARAELNATVSIRVKNTSKRSWHLYFRRELVSYEVMGPDGLVTCDAQPDDRAPDRQAFANLRPGRSVSVTSRLVELCPRGTFGRPGLYLVHARLESNDSGEEWNIDAFVGDVHSKEPAAIRIRTGELSFLKKQAMVAIPRDAK
jgi:hypothetical protein